MEALMKRVPWEFTRTYLEIKGLGYYSYYNEFICDIFDDLLKPFSKHEIQLLFKYRHQLVNIIKSYKKVMNDISIKEYIFNDILNHYKLKIASKKIVTFVIETYKTKFLIYKEIIARNRKDGLPDVICPVFYNPKKHEYLHAAFSGAFRGGIEDGRLVIYTKKMETTQEAVKIYCTYITNQFQGQKMLDEYFIENLSKGYDFFKEAIESVCKIADICLFPTLQDDCSQYLMKYINSTLYNRGYKSIKRLHLFLETNPILAHHIWITNFATEEERLSLGYQLDISTRNLNGFVKSTSINELKEYLDKKKQFQNVKTIYDNLPNDMKLKISKAENDLISAKKGHSIGLYGAVYISSDEIDVAQNRLNVLWKNADRYLSTQSKKK
jgi:hypothetical protein